MSPDLICDCPGVEPFVLGFFVAFCEECFLHGRKVGGAIKYAEVFISFGDLGIENLQRLCIAIVDHNCWFGKTTHRFVTPREGVDE